MIKAVRQRFVFHFEGERGTNRLDKVRLVYVEFTCADGLSLTPDAFIVAGMGVLERVGHDIRATSVWRSLSAGPCRAIR